MSSSSPTSKRGQKASLASGSASNTAPMAPSGDVSTSVDPSALSTQPQPQPSPSTNPTRKRRAPMADSASSAAPTASSNEPSSTVAGSGAASGSPSANAPPLTTPSIEADAARPPPAKKGRTNKPWTPQEEQRLKIMRDAGNSWSEIAKTFPDRTEGSVKKHWYKDMHYAEFAQDESDALLAAIKEYESNKWKFIGQKVGKPAKACEQYAKEHFGGKT